MKSSSGKAMPVGGGVKKIVYASSGGAIYGNSISALEGSQVSLLSPYALSKYSIEKYIEYYKEVYNIDYCILRFSNVMLKLEYHLSFNHYEENVITSKWVLVIFK